jgi:transposase
VVQAFLKRNEPWKKAISISHEKSRFEQLGEILIELQTRLRKRQWLFWKQPALSSWTCLLLGTQRMDVFHRQPFTDQAGKRYSVKKGEDGCCRCVAFSRDVSPGRCKSVSEVGEGYIELQHVTRQHEFVTGMFVQAKLNMRALLDQVFTEY